MTNMFSPRGTRIATAEVNSLQSATPGQFCFGETEVARLMSFLFSWRLPRNSQNSHTTPFLDCSDKGVQAKTIPKESRALPISCVAPPVVSCDTIPGETGTNIHSSKRRTLPKANLLDQCVLLGLLTGVRVGSRNEPDSTAASLKAHPSTDGSSQKLKSGS